MDDYSRMTQLDLDLALSKAASSGLIDKINALHAAGANINFEGQGGAYPPIHDAVWGGSLSAVKRVVELGANIEFIHKDKTPLALAIKRDKIEIAIYLIEIGANYHFFWNEKGKTLLEVMWDSFGLFSRALVATESGDRMINKHHTITQARTLQGLRVKDSFNFAAHERESVIYNMAGQPAGLSQTPFSQIDVKILHDAYAVYKEKGGTLTEEEAQVPPMVTRRVLKRRQVNEGS